MRLIDADALYERTAEWEAQALHMVEVTMNDEDKTKWQKWSTILAERSAFKHDIADAPVIEPEQRWILCSERLPGKADHINEMVLVCYRNGSVRFNTYMNGWVQGNPVAWMSLPEPYKGGQE